MIQRREADWVFGFENSARLTVETLWRIVSEGRIAVTSSDDRQRFGLPSPLDVEAEARGLLGEKSVTAVVVDSETADLTVDFGSSVRLQVLHSSAGYEAWNVVFDFEGKGRLIVAIPGGGLAIFSDP